MIQGPISHARENYTISGAIALHQKSAVRYIECFVGINPLNIPAEHLLFCDIRPVVWSFEDQLSFQTLLTTFSTSPFKRYRGVN